MTKRIAPWVVFGVFIVYLGVAAFAAPAQSVSGFDLREFRRLPVSVSGRVQPIDTLARLALLRISGSGSVSVDGSGNQRQAGSLDADEWLLEILAKPDAADARRIFPVDDTVAGKLSLRPGGGTVFYAFRELSGKVEEIGKQTQRIGKLKAGDRAGWETELLRLQSRLVAYERLKNSLQPNSILQREAKGSPIAFDYAQMLGRFRADLLEASRIARRRTDGKADTLDPATEGRIRSFAGAFQAVSRLALVVAIPPHSGEPRSRWSNAGTEIANSARGSALSPAVGYWSKMGSAYAHGDAGAFEAAVSAYRGWLASSGLRREVSRAAWEVFYNGLQPMLRAVPVYILGLMLLFAAGADASKAGRRPAARPPGVRVGRSAGGAGLRVAHHRTRVCLHAGRTTLLPRVRRLDDRAVRAAHRVLLAPRPRSGRGGHRRLDRTGGNLRARSRRLCPVRAEPPRRPLARGDCRGGCRSRSRRSPVREAGGRPCPLGAGDDAGLRPCPTHVKPAAHAGADDQQSAMGGPGDEGVEQ